MMPSSSTASGGSASCNTCSNSPCYLSSGTYADSFRDLQIPTAGTYPLNVSRRYDSGRPTDGPFGVGWSSTLTAHLYYAAYLLSAPSTYAYEADVIMPSGALYRFTMSAGSFVTPAGTFDSLVKNGDGTYSLTLGHTRSVYRFNADGSLASLTDDYGNAIAYSYDSSGRLFRTTDSAGSGRYMQVSWNASGRIGSIADNAGRVLKYWYDTNGLLTGFSDPVTSPDPSLRTKSYSYVAGRFGPLLSRIEDRWHRTISNLLWYPDGRLQSYTDGDYDDADPASSPGEKYTYTYNGTTVTKTHSLGLRQYIWSPSGVANNATQSFDPTTGLVTSEIGPAGNTVSYTYNSRGNVATAMYGTDQWIYTYDANYPDSLAIVSPPSSSWAGWKYLYYDGVNGGPPGALMKVSRVGADGVASTTVDTFAYDSRGHLTSHAGSSGDVQIYAYNAAGDVTSAAAAGSTTTYDYDVLGRVVKVTPPSGHPTTYSYDDNDRIRTISLPSPAAAPTLDFTTRIGYDNYDATSGLVSTITTDPSGQVTNQAYDSLGHLIRSTDAIGNVTQYSFQYDLLHSITDANSNVTSYAYNSDRYLTRITYFDGTFETHLVNAAGGITSVTDRRGQTTNYQYDAYGRVTSNAVSTFQYAGQNLISAAGVNYTYDSQWHVATETQAGGDAIAYTYAYGSDVLVSYRIDPPPGQTGNSVTTNFGYDGSGRVSSLQWSPVSGSFTFSYNADGQYSAIHFPNGQSRSFTYDNQGRLASLANLDVQAHNVLTFTYAYDYDWPSQSYRSLGNRTSLNVSGSVGQYSNGTTKYIYDASDQLVGVTHADGSTSSYTYDAIGNRTQSVINGVTLPFAYFQNAILKNTPRLRNTGGADLTYDSNGNLTTGGYTWDIANRLAAISGLQFQYDFQNRRNLYTPAPGTGSPVRYIAFGLNTVAERSTDATRSNDYLFGPGIDEPLARRASDGSVRYYVVDGLGSVVALTSSSGQIVNTATYDEWGVTSGVDFVGYTGQMVARPVSGLWSFRARYYRPDWGRFISEDPMAGIGANSLYAYAGNDPINWTDPSGMLRRKDACKAPCDELLQAINDVTDELEQRWTVGNQLQGQGTFTRHTTAQGHIDKYIEKQENLQEFIREFKDRCGPPPQRAIDWSKRPQPYPTPPAQQAGSQKRWSLPSLPTMPAWVPWVVGGAVAGATCILCPECCLAIALGSL